MPLNDLNRNAISFKKVVGKAHTQQTFAFTEEPITSNVAISYSTVFGEDIQPLPATNGGLTATGNTDGIVEKVRFEVEIISDTEIGVNQSQGYQLKLPSAYSGSLSSVYSGGTVLNTALGKLQIVPALYGTLKGDGTTEYDPVLFQTDGVTEITKFDSINWILDTYNGVLFVQDPPAGYDIDATRPAFLEAFLYVGDYLDEVIASGVSSSLVAGQGISSTQLALDIIELELASFTASTGISITTTGSTGFNVTVGDGQGIQYTEDYFSGFTDRSLVDKGYVDYVSRTGDAKLASNVATTTDIDLTGGTFLGVVDGTPVQDGWRVLVKDQSDPSENGIYDYNLSASTFSRSFDFNDSPTGKVTTGAHSLVVSGDTNGNTIWAVINEDPIDVGTTDIFWRIFGAGTGSTVSNGSNLGSGSEVFVNNSGNSLNFRTIVGSGATTVSEDGNQIVINTSVANQAVRITTTTGDTILVTDDVVVASGTTDFNLPASPATGFQVSISDGLGTALTTPITINGNGNDIQDDTFALINTDFGAITFVYNGIFWTVSNFIP
jgi:hypothetical protein